MRKLREFGFVFCCRHVSLSRIYKLSHLLLSHMDWKVFCIELDHVVSPSYHCFIQIIQLSTLCDPSSVGTTKKVELRQTTLLLFRIFHGLESLIKFLNPIIRFFWVRRYPWIFKITYHSQHCQHEHVCLIKHCLLVLQYYSDVCQRLVDIPSMRIFFSFGRGVLQVQCRSYYRHHSSTYIKNKVKSNPRSWHI